jgi:peptide/nickel transport system permease protein
LTNPTVEVAAEASGTSVQELSASTFDATKARRQSVVIIRRFLRHRLAMISLFVFVALFLFAFIGGALWKYSYTFEDVSGGGRYLAPTGDHPFGTDALAADSMAQVLRGTQFSIVIALVVAFLSTSIGVVLGALAGFFRGWVDSMISRFIDLVLVIPAIVLVGVLSRNSFGSSATTGGGGNWYIIALFLGLTGWTGVARVIRGMTLSLREKEFVEAARALGGGVGRLVFRHILPNTLDVIIVNATIAVSQAVLAEALHPWLFWFPFVFIILISLTANFIGDGLRDAFDPRQKRVRA